MFNTLPYDADTGALQLTLRKRLTELINVKLMRQEMINSGLETTSASLHSHSLRLIAFSSFFLSPLSLYLFILLQLKCHFPSEPSLTLWTQAAPPVTCFHPVIAHANLITIELRSVIRSSVAAPLDRASASESTKQDLLGMPSVPKQGAASKHLLGKCPDEGTESNTNFITKQR